MALCIPFPAARARSERSRRLDRPRTPHRGATALRDAPNAPRVFSCRR